jgi:hypothetical protein
VPTTTTKRPVPLNYPLLPLLPLHPTNCPARVSARTNVGLPAVVPHRTFHSTRPPARRRLSHPHAVLLTSQQYLSPRSTACNAGGAKKFTTSTHLRTIAQPTHRTWPQLSYHPQANIYTAQRRSLVRSSIKLFSRYMFPLMLFFGVILLMGLRCGHVWMSCAHIAEQRVPSRLFPAQTRRRF